MIAENVEYVRRRMALACKRAGRSVEEITLVAVSKTFSGNHIREAVAAGVLDIGESFVQELVRKRTEVQDDTIRWHFVGHLQTNKVKYIAEWIYLIHSVDSFRLAKELNKFAEQRGRAVRILLEVNTSGEATKYGVSPDRVEELVKATVSLPAVRLEGLMTIGPLLSGEDPETARPSFRLLREVRDTIERKHGIPLPRLSMGMTGDFETAIEEGATMIRVGTAIFGQRRQKVGSKVHNP